MPEIEYGIAVLTSEGLAVIEAAVAYCDQLCSFNDPLHPEVQSRRLELAAAVDGWHARAVGSAHEPVPVEDAK